MLRFLPPLVRALRLVGGLLVADAFTAYLLTFFGHNFVEVAGDLMLVEVAVLFIVAGLLDFSTSIGAAQFRKTIFAAKQGYSAARHKEAGWKALVFFLAGLILLLILVTAALYTRL